MAGLRWTNEGDRQRAEQRSKLQFLLQSAASLAATSIVTAGLGFVYWAVAARAFAASDVGESSTAISAMGLLGPLTMLGLGTLVMVQLPAMQQGRSTLVSSATLLSGVAASVVALAGAFLLPSGYLGIPDIGHRPLATLIFVALVATQAMGLVLDQALLAVLGGGIQLGRNLIQSVVKLVALVLLAFTLERFGAVVILVSWLVANVVSIAAVVMVLMRRHDVPLRRIVPRPSVLRGMHFDAAKHHALNTSLMAPYFAMPIVANVILGSEKAAYLYATWSLAGFVFFLPISLATALFASGARDTSTFIREFRFTLRIALVICAIANVAIFVLGGLVLSIFGRTYADNGHAVLIVLALGGFGLIVKDHHFTLARVTDRVGREALLMAVLGVLEVVGAVIGAMRGGLLGLSLGWLVAIGLEVVVCGPLVWRAYRGKVDVPVRSRIAVLAGGLVTVLAAMSIAPGGNAVATAGTLVTTPFLDEFNGPAGSPPNRDHWVADVGSSSVSIGADGWLLKSFTPQSLLRDSRWVFGGPMFLLLNPSRSAEDGPGRRTIRRRFRQPCSSTGCVSSR